MKLFFVGDGERDAATVPHLVKRLLDTSFDVRTAHWARLNYGTRGTRRTRHKGYTAKVLYALRQARDACADGLVATVDADAKRSRRLKALKAGRNADRAQRVPLPAALGEAIPHGEA